MLNAVKKQFLTQALTFTYQCLNVLFTNVRLVNQNNLKSNTKKNGSYLGLEVKKAEYLKAYQRETDAGVYAVYEDLDIIYIGQSTMPEQRRVAHFSKHIKPIDKWQPKIPYDLATGKLDRTRLSFDMIEYVEDKDERMKREKYHLEQHKLAFGDYPRYNTDSTGRKRGHIIDKRKDS